MIQGASLTLENLLALRFSAAAIQPDCRSKSFSQLSGAARAHYRGRGIDFEEVRHYQPGDEPRAIDWRVTARSGRAHTKLFNEERERPTLLVVDQRASMRFGSRCCFKSVQAATVAGLLGWASLNNHDRVGGLVFDDRDHFETRPGSGHKSLLAFFQQLAAFNQRLLHSPPAGEAEDTPTAVKSFHRVATQVQRIARPGMAIFIASDFSGIDSDAQAVLSQVRRHSDIIAIHISDPMEQALPALPAAWFSDGRQRLHIDLQNPSLRETYQRDYSASRRELADRLSAAGISMLSVSTEDNTKEALEYYFSARGRQSRPKRARA